MERNVHKQAQQQMPCTNERNASHNSRRNVLLHELFTKANIMLISPGQEHKHAGGRRNVASSSNVYSLRRNVELKTTMKHELECPFYTSSRKKVKFMMMA